ncbi:MAG TPA: PhzF family phenazine biosynthesis protein [Pyrinomonadaceae bacterium]
MRKLHYRIVDVFTNRAFGGNPLAVFPDAGELPLNLMQSIAKELNLSETTFVTPARDAQHDFRVRIFTPASELPMAGHPTVGTAYVLAREGMIERSETATKVNFEEGVGTIPVTINFRDGVPDWIEMQQPSPTFGPRITDVEAVAQMLSLDAEAIKATSLPLEVVSCGVPFLFVPLRNLESIRKIRFRLDVWEKALRNAGVPMEVFVFTEEVETAGSRVHSRMFAPALGIGEDPATGAASGPLGCYLVRHGIVRAEPRVELISEQGIEMNRPSFIKIGIEQTAGEITRVTVSGQCYFMGAGYLEVEQA